MRQAVADLGRSQLGDKREVVSGLPVAAGPGAQERSGVIRNRQVARCHGGIHVVRLRRSAERRSVIARTRYPGQVFGAFRMRIKGSGGSRPRASAT
jgi:hypothetical protein